MKIKFLKFRIADSKGMAVLISILLIGVLLSIVFTLSSLLTRKIKLSYYSKDTVAAIYAAETGAEWCLYRKKDDTAVQPAMINGSSFEVNPIAATYQLGDGGAFSETNDSVIKSAASDANDNFGGLNSMSSGRPFTWTSALIQFPNLIGDGFGQVPLNSNISQATLRLTQSPPGNIVSGPIAVRLYKLLKSWNEGTGNVAAGIPANAGEVTWNAAEHNVMPWMLPGALAANNPALPTDDRSFFDIGAAITVSADNPTHFIFDITSAVQAWADGEPNYGLLIEHTGINFITYYFYTSDESTLISERPLLSVTGGSCSIGDIKSIGTYRGTTRALEVTF